MNLADSLRPWATYRPDKLALVDGDTGACWTYAELDARARAVATHLRDDHGVGPGDRVAVLAWNRVEQIDLFFACARLGAILVPLNWRLAPPEIAEIVRDCGPRITFCGAELASVMAEVAAITLLRSVLLREDFSWPATEAPVEPVHADEGQAVMLLYTSGSTGRPKGAILTHGSLTWNSHNTCAGWELRASDVALVFTPLFHTGGWGVFLLPLLHRGGTCVLTRRFDAGQCLRLVDEWGISHLFAVPTMWEMLANHPDFETTRFGALRFAITGGAACPLPLLDRWAARGVSFKQGFGLTEVGPNCFVMPDGHERSHAGTVGFPMPYLEARRVGDDGSEAPFDVPGELWLSGPTVCAGYWNDPASTAASRRDGRWFATGDLFTRDPSGHYRFVGRKKEIFVSGGENVHPAEVERALYDLPGVAEAAVVPMPDPKWGEVGAAFLAWKDGAPNLDTATVTDLLRPRLARYKIPRSIRTLASLPKGPSGKIDKRALLDLIGG